MTYATIDSIVYGALLSNNLTIHYYVQLANEALDCLSELSYDVLPTPKSVRLTVNAFNEVELPSDYVDWMRVGRQYGVQVLYLLPTDNFNRLANLDDAEEQIPYSTPSQADELTYDSNAGYWWTNNVSSYGENLGRYYGYGGGKMSGFFKPVEERGVIQFDGSIEPGDEIYLEYLAFDTATVGSLVPKYAESTIKSYVSWKYREWSRLYGLAEVESARREYYNNLRKLRGRMNPLTTELIKQIARRHFKQSLKL